MFGNRVYVIFNFGCMTHLAGLNLILKFDVVKSSKCHVCVESKQHRKTHKSAVARDLAPLELIHSDVCLRSMES